MATKNFKYIELYEASPGTWMGAKPQRIAKLGKLTAPSKRRLSSFPRKSGGL